LTLFALAFLSLIPLLFYLFSLANLITIPGQLVRLFKNKRARQNHALEHATINILENEYGYSRLAGLSLEDGFFIFGLDEPELVLEASKEGLIRLQKGDKELALHRQCGTSTGISLFLFSLLFLIFFFFSGLLVWFPLALLLAIILSPYLGLLTQQLVTTSSDVNNLVIAGVTTAIPAEKGVPLLIQPEIFVRTLPLLEAEVIRES
jgi:hypothetical protein